MGKKPIIKVKRSPSERWELSNMLRFILSEREATVIEMRFGFMDGNIYTFREIAGEFNRSRSRIAQIEAIALRKLRKRIEKLTSLWSVLEQEMK